MILTNLIAPSFYEIHKDIKREKYTHHWIDGGRGSTKSSFIAIEIILGLMADSLKGIYSNAVALRKVKDNLHGSVYEQLVWAIEMLGVSSLWDIPKTKLELTFTPTGQRILFRGADKPKKIKSIKFAKGYCKYIWFEELDEFAGTEEVRMINQSLMRGGSKFVCFYSYNPPKSVANWVNTEATLTRPDRLTHHSNYLSVPTAWLGEQFLIEAEQLKDNNLTSYNHEYLGEVTGTGGEVFSNITIRQITDDEIKHFEQIRRGLDYGFAVDPLSYGVMNYDRKNKKLYIFYELYKVGLSNKMATDIILTENKKYETIIADSSEPKSISEMQQYGLKIKAVKKFGDSIDYGIKFLQDLSEIIIDDTRCPSAGKEFLNYEYEKDGNGNFKAGYPDKNNHFVDCTRYALNDDMLRHIEEVKTEKPLSEIKYEKMIQGFGGKMPNLGR